jgi:hypothetical protein
VNDHLTTDARHHINPGCPIDVEVLEADEQVEVVIGTQHATGDVVRLVLSDPDTCYVLANRFIRARNLMTALVERANRSGPALPQMDSSGAAAVVSTATAGKS